MKKVFSIVFKIGLIIFLLISLLVLCLGIYVLFFNKTPFNSNLLINNALTIEVYNQQNLLLDEDNTFNPTKISLDSIPQHTKQAFISIEDKDFYKHNGISVKRMGKALLKNISKMKIVEGASTISQQLIKNTFLSSEKTFSRKLNEISLALELEKKYSKDDILENYLNIIYFGNNCYGIENASKYYFSKNASKLNINESALLAGLIKSPSKYSPINNPQNALNRRNLVLSEMFKDGYLTEVEFLKEKSSDLNLNINKTRKNKLNSYSQSAIDEATQILKMPAKQIAIAGYKIHTYQNLDKQIILEETIKTNFSELENYDFSLMDVNSKTGGIEAYIGQSDYKILDHKRQPASTIKPLLVYAPAINENIITPASLILDEEISIDGFSPKNVSNSYAGYISARECLSKSLNIPSIKILSYLGINKAKSYASKLNITLDEKDLNYSLALGGMTYGATLKQLSGAYTALANSGNFTKAQFVKYITNSEGKIVYKNKEEKKKVFSEDTAFLTTDMLKTCAQTGTAKKLQSLDFEIASKTGTVGTSKGNTDAYNISYTSENVFGVWIGRLDNQIINTAGGNLPTILARDYNQKIYKLSPPENFKKPNSIVYCDIDLIEYETNHNIVLANDLTPERFKKKELFSRFNLPQTESSPVLTLTPPNLNGYIKNNQAILTFDADNHFSYEIYKETEEKTHILKTFSGERGVKTIYDDIKENEKASYYLITKLYSNNGETVINQEKSNVINLFNLKSTLPENRKEKWYI